MIYEIFNCVDGKTQGYRFGREAAERVVMICPNAMEDGEGNLIVLDFIPAPDGFYVLDMSKRYKAGPFEDRRKAEAKRDMENMGTDTNSYSVFHNYSPN